MKQYTYKTTCHLCFDRTIEGKQLTNADREAIDDALNTGDFHFSCDIDDASNYASHEEETIILGDVEWDTPDLMPIEGRQEVVVTFEFTIESNIQDKARLDRFVWDALIFQIDGYETAEYC